MKTPGMPQRPHLRAELELLSKREAEEAEKLETGRSRQLSELKAAEADVAELSEQLARARHEVSLIREDLDKLGPSKDANLVQLMQDRLAVFGRVLGADRYELDGMIAELDRYRLRVEEIESLEREDPKLGLDRDLVSEVSQNDGLFEALPESVRAVLLERVEAARDRLAGMETPEPPQISAIVYVVEGAIEGGGHAYLAVAPVSVRAEEALDDHSSFLVNLIAEMCQALSHRPAFHAPIVMPLPDREFGMVISVVDEELSEDESGLFAIRLEDRLQQASSQYRSSTEPIDDPLLRQALADLVALKLADGF